MEMEMQPLVQKDSESSDSFSSDLSSSSSEAVVAVKKDPVKKDHVKEDPVKKDPVKKDPVKKDPVKKDPVKKDPVKKDPDAFRPTYSFNREKAIFHLDLGDGSLLMLWIQAVQMDVVNGVQTLRGDAMLDLGERGKKDWCGFKDLIIKLAPYGPQSIAVGQAFQIPKWWYEIVTDNRRLSKFLTGHSFPVQYPLRHRRFLENEPWPVSEEQWKTIQDLRLVLA